MTGPEHYREAERLLNMLPSHGTNSETGLDRAETFAAAQVHATLATIPPDHIAVYEWTQQRLIERLTEEHCLDAFRVAWQAADELGLAGDRVRQGMIAAVKAALL